MARTNKKISKPKRTRSVHKDSSEMTLYEYITSISAEEKYEFYEEAYTIYMKKLEKDDPERYHLVKETEDLLQKKFGTWLVSYIFKRIVPTFCDNEPITFLHEALKEAEYHDFDSLCVFLQIACFRWTLIEKSYKRRKKKRKWGEGNKWWKESQLKYLIPLFENMRKDSTKFIVGYRNNIVSWLVKQGKKLAKYLKIIEKERPKAKEDIKEIIKNYESRNVKDVEELIKNNTEIQAYYRTRYDEWLEDQNEEKVCFQSANRSFRLSELEDTIWKKLPPWNIQNSKKVYNVEDSFFTWDDNTPLDVLIKNINEVESTNEKLFAPEQKVQFYEDLYRLFIARISKTSHEHALVIQTIENDLLELPEMGMVLYMFKRIVPTLCDYKPIALLQAAIQHVYQLNNYSWLSLFMQISSFRWGRIESNYANSSGTMNATEERQWINKPDGQLLAPFFEKMREDSKGVYNVDVFNKGYKDVIIPELVKEWNQLKERLVVIRKRHPELDSYIDEILEAHKKKDQKRIEEILLTNIEPLKRAYRKIYTNLCNPKGDVILYFGSVNRYYLLSSLEKVLFTSFESWNIQEHIINGPICVYKDIISILEESIVLSKESKDM